MVRPNIERSVSRGIFAASSTMALIAIGSTFVADDRTVGMVAFFWIASLIPAFLMAYFRGLSDAALIIATGMCAVAAFRVARAATGNMDGLGMPNPAAIIAVAVGVPMLLELRFRELRRGNRVSLVDAVSGLPNREYFDLTIERAFAAAQRGHQLIIVEFDIDNLWSINTRFGRPSGTAVVRTFAKLLFKQSRREDLSVRYDDARFITLLADTDIAGANAFASRVLEQFRRSPFPWGRQSVSAGVAAFNPSMASPDFLIDEADRAVRRAKASGKDMVALPLSAAEQDAIRRRSLQITADHLAIADFVAEEGTLVYVVDDDAQLRSEMKGALIHAGYRVWDTDNPELAIRRFAKAKPSLRPLVIVADEIMPVMSGIRMMERIVELDPAVGVVYLLSFTDIATVERPGAIVRVLNKPLSIPDLMESVAAAAVTRTAVAL
jgi:diguanylate cyclase (GGDEF)-like protein